MAKTPESMIEETVPGFHGTLALDRAFKANLARLTNGISPAGLLKAVGYSRAAIAWHYVKLVLIISFIGIAIG